MHNTLAYLEKVIFDAARDGNLSVLRQYLQETGVSVNDKYKTRINYAYFGKTVLHVSAEYGNTETVTALVNECGADVSARDNINSTALHCAARGGHLSVVHFLVSVPGIELTAKDNAGMTPLDLCPGNGTVFCIIAVAVLASGSEEIPEQLEEELLVHLPKLAG